MAIIDIPVSPPRSTRAKVRAAAIAATAGAAVLFVVAGVPVGHRINAEGAAEKTSLVQWAAAGGETAFRFTTLSAKTGGEMFFSPDFSFEHAGEEYRAAGKVTSAQMGELAQNFVVEGHAPSLPPGEEKPYYIHAADAKSIEAKPMEAKPIEAMPMPAEKRAAFEVALQVAETPEEKTSLLDWAAAGAETAFRFTTLSAKTGFDMFFSPDFSFEHAGEDYRAAGEVTSEQMGDLSQNFVVAGHAPSLPPGEEKPYYIHAADAKPIEALPMEAKPIEAMPMPAEKRAAFEVALQMAETPEEKTSLLQWAAAGGETAFRFTTLSAKTGAEMFFSPDFTFEHAGDEYRAAGKVTSQQMGDLSQNFVIENHAPSLPPGEEKPYFIHS